MTSGVLLPTAQHFYQRGSLHQSPENKCSRCCHPTLSAVCDAPDFCRNRLGASYDSARPPTRSCNQGVHIISYHIIHTAKHGLVIVAAVIHTLRSHRSNEEPYQYGNANTEQQWLVLHCYPAASPKSQEGRSAVCAVLLHCIIRWYDMYRSTTGTVPQKGSKNTMNNTALVCHMSPHHPRPPSWADFRSLLVKKLRMVT